MKIRRLICLKCGNTDNFVVDSRRECVEATLYFDNKEAYLEDDFATDVEIFPSYCAKCGSEDVRSFPNTQISAMFDAKILTKELCEQCKNRFKCYTEKSECIGFMFEHDFAELL